VKIWWKLVIASRSYDREQPGGVGCRVLLFVLFVTAGCPPVGERVMKKVTVEWLPPAAITAGEDQHPHTS